MLGNHTVRKRHRGKQYFDKIACSLRAVVFRELGVGKVSIIQRGKCYTRILPERDMRICLSLGRSRLVSYSPEGVSMRSRGL